MTTPVPETEAGTGCELFHVRLTSAVVVPALSVLLKKTGTPRESVIVGVSVSVPAEAKGNAVAGLALSAIDIWLTGQTMKSAGVAR